MLQDIYAAMIAGLGISGSDGDPQEDTNIENLESSAQSKASWLSQQQLTPQVCLDISEIC